MSYIFIASHSQIILICYTLFLIYHNQTTLWSPIIVSSTPDLGWTPQWIDCPGKPRAVSTLARVGYEQTDDGFQRKQ